MILVDTCWLTWMGLVLIGWLGRAEDPEEELEEDESESDPDSSSSRALAAAATAAYPTRGASTAASTTGRWISLPFPLASRRAWRAGTRGASSSEEEEPSELEESEESDAAARLFLLRGLRFAAAEVDLGAIVGRESGKGRKKVEGVEREGREGEGKRRERELESFFDELIPPSLPSFSSTLKLHPCLFSKMSTPLALPITLKALPASWDTSSKVAGKITRKQLLPALSFLPSLSFR